MIIFQFALMILSIALVIAISLKLFWFASFLIIYRSLSSLITFEYIAEKFGIDQHIYYFLFMMVLTIGLHYLIMFITSNMIFLRYVIYITLLMWILYYFDLKEIFLLTDWLDQSGIEFTFDYFKNLLIELATTPPGDYINAVIEFINGVSDAITKFIKGIFGIFVKES